MQVITNESLIKRNARIGQISSIAGLAVLAAGMILSFSQPELVFISLACLLVGFILSQIGIFFGNRWGRRPRPDELISAALKGLDGSYRLYHYSSPTGHLLVGPAGLWILLPRHQRGTITYEKGRWRQRGGGFFLAYMKFFAQEGLGRPDLDAAAEIEALQRFLKEKFPDEEHPEIQVALVFTNERADIQAEDAPLEAVQIKKLKELIRKTAKNRALPVPKAKSIQDALASL